MFEIKNMRLKNHEMFKASFTVSFSKLDLNDLAIVNGRDGLFVSNASRPYEVNGEKKYANYYFVKDSDLRKQITDKAVEVYQQVAGSQSQPKDIGDIPF